MSNPRVIDLQLRQRPSVALAVPTTEFVPRKAFAAMMFLAAFGLKAGDEYYPMQRVATIHTARNEIVKWFLGLPETVQFLIMLDSDMVPPTNLVDVWVGREDYRFPFISAYCTRKEWPYLPIPAKRGKGVEIDGVLTPSYDPITNLMPNSGVVEVDGVGMAAVCIRRDVLAAMEPPYFAFDGAGGEDYYFCRKLGGITHLKGWERGVPVLVDTHIQVGHIGETVATPALWLENKQVWMEQTGNEEYDLIPAEGIDTDRPRPFALAPPAYLADSDSRKQELIVELQAKHASD